MKLKKLLPALAGGLVALLVGVGPQPAYAGLFGFGDTPVTIHYSKTSITASTTAILVDLSDTTNFKHSKTNGANIDSIRLDIGKVAGSSGTIKLGVVTEVDASNGSVYWFTTKHMQEGTVEKNLDDEIGFSLSKIRTRIDPDNDVPLYFATNDSSLGDTTYQTDVNLPTVLGSNAAPAEGDIIFQFTNDGGDAWNISLRLSYSTD